ncbi:MAG: XRE family transcriptional regulator [Alphaproteobacteria bacterium]
MNDADIDAVTARIGNRVREERHTKRLTLSELASLSGLSEGFLSRLERGHAACSIANLIHICQALGIDLSDMFAQEGKPPRSMVTLHRASNGNPGEVTATGYRYRHLAGGALQDDMEIFHLVFPAQNGMETRVAHPGQEHCFVLGGEIDFLVGNEQHRLGPGDGILIDSGQPHLARNAGDTPAEVIMTVTHVGAPAAPEWWRPVTATEEKGTEEANDK